MEELTESCECRRRPRTEKLIRMMSHEVNNTVGATASLLDACLHYRDQIAPADRDDFERALRVVIGRTREMGAFMEGFSEVVRLPAPRRREVDLGGMIEDVGALFRAELERGGSPGGWRPATSRSAWRWTGDRSSRRSSTSSRTRWRPSARGARSRCG
jgi:hypothetical protein